MTDKNQSTDPIIEELHTVRRKLHDDCNGDLDKLAREMRERQDASGHPIASIPVSRSRSLEQSLERPKSDATT